MANNYKSVKADLTTTSNTTIYTCPVSATAILKSILVTEDAGSGTDVSMTITTSGAVVYNLFKTKAIAANATDELLTNPLVLNGGDILKVQAGTANTIHILLSMLEVS